MLSLLLIISAWQYILKIFFKRNLHSQTSKEKNSHPSETRNELETAERAMLPGTSCDRPMMIAENSLDLSFCLDTRQQLQETELLLPNVDHVSFPFRISKIK